MSQHMVKRALWALSSDEVVATSAAAYGVWCALTPKRARDAPLSTCFNAGIDGVLCCMGGAIAAALLGRPLAALVPVTCAYSVVASLARPRRPRAPPPQPAPPTNPPPYPAAQ